MARIKIGDWLIEDAALTMSGGRLCLRWAADAWDGTLDSAAELLGVADELRELDADDMTVALYAVRGLASLRMDAEHAAMEAVLCVDPMEVEAAEKMGQQIEQQGRELGTAIEAAETALGKRIDGQEALLGAARVAARRTVAADADNMTADELSDCVPLFDAWDGSSVAYAMGDIVAYGGALYRCAQAHTSQAGWTPDISRALWTPMGISADDPEAVPDWVQPTGAHDAYAKGSHVMHGGVEWVSDLDANVWEPGVSGWTQVGGDAG
ncbi:MAG: carbohydrate-binding protein [Christensenellales bacterium]